MQKNRKSRKVDFRRVLAAVLCLVLAVSFMPSTAMAAEIVIGEETFTEAAADSFETEDIQEPEAEEAPAGDIIEGEEIVDDELPSDEEGEALPEEDEDGEAAEDISEDNPEVVDEDEEKELADIIENRQFALEVSIDADVPVSTASLMYEFRDADGRAIGAVEVLELSIPDDILHSFIRATDVPANASIIELYISTGGSASVVNAKESSIKMDSATVVVTRNIVSGLTGSGYQINIEGTSLFQASFRLSNISGSFTDKQYSIGITSDENVTANNMGLNWSFADNAGYSLPGDGGLTVFPASEGDDHQYTNATGDTAFLPKEVYRIYLRANTAGVAEIDWPDDTRYYIKVNGESIFDETWTPEYVSEALVSEGGFELGGLDESSQLEISLHYASNGHVPVPEDGGMYKVTVDIMDGIPEGVEPSVEVWFNTRETGVYYSESMPYWDQLPTSRVGDEDKYPTQLTVDIDNEYLEYFASGRLRIYDDGVQIDEIDFFDTLREEENWFVFPEGDDSLDPNLSYEIIVAFSNTRSICWSYREEDRGTDYFVENCRIFLQDDAGEDIPVEDDFADYQLMIGREYKFRLVPDMGYQVAGLSINGYTVEPTNDKGEFSFIMSDSNFHLSGVVERVGTVADISAENVGKLWVNNDEIGAFEPEATPDGGSFDEDFGGSYMLTVQDNGDDVDYKDATKYADPDQATEEVLAMVAEDTIDISIDQAVLQDSARFRPDYWKEDEVLTELTEEAEFEFVYAGVEGADYKVATEHDGEITILDAKYEDEKLSFKTSEFSTFTILRGHADVDDVIFNFINVDGFDEAGDEDNPFEDEFKLVPVPGAGLKEYDFGPIAGDTYWYSYTGGNIILRVLRAEDGSDPDRDEVFSYYEGWINKIGAQFICSKDPWFDLIYFSDYSEEGTYIVVPAISDDREHPFPIQDMLNSALEYARKEETVPMIMLQGAGFFERPAKQVELLGEDLVSYDFDFDGSNVETVTQDGKTWYFIGGDDAIYFKVDPAADGVVISDITYNVIESIESPDCDWEHGDPSTINVIRDDFPIGHAELVDEEESIYMIPVPYRDEDWDASYGVQIVPIARKMTRVEVNFDEDYFFYQGWNDRWARAFDVTVRTGAQEYIVSYAEQEGEEGGSSTAVAYVPTGENVSVKITSSDGYNKIIGAKVEAKAATPDKSGEYSLSTTGKSKVSLTIATEKVAKLQLYWLEDEDVEFGDPISSENGKYHLCHDDIFVGLLGYGSEYKPAENGFVPKVLNDAKFKIGTKSLDDFVDDGAIRATGDLLELAGKTAIITASSGSASASVSIQFTVAVTAKNLKVEGANKQGVIKIPYGARKTLKVTLPKGAYSEEIDVYLIDPEYHVIVGHPDFAVYDTQYASNIGYLYFDCDYVVEDCDPGQLYTIGFASRNARSGSKAIAEYSVTFTDDIKGKTPTVKANDKLTTHQELGLSLALPKGVKAADALYYRVEAETEVIPDPDFEIDGVKIEGKTNLNYWDDWKGQLVEVYRPTVTCYIPSSEKTATINVMADDHDSESGWGGMQYTVKATLVYAFWGYDGDEEEAAYIEREWKSETAMLKAPIFTKQVAYETKLGLTKKCSSVIYSGASDVWMADAKWSTGTSVKEFDQIQVTNSVGNIVARWDRWNGSDAYQCPVYVDGSSIYLSTYRYDEREEDGEWYTVKEPLRPGKYTLTAWAVGGPGVYPQASFTFQIKNGIERLEVSAPATLLKTENKKSTFTAGVSYFGPNDEVPANKKVTWEIIKEIGHWDEEADDYMDLYFEEGDPLYGMLSVNAKGVVTLDPAYRVSPYDYENTFILKAIAADYDNSDVVAYSRLITITTTEQIPTKIYFRWYNDWEDRYNYSIITDEAIARGEKFYTGAINGSEVQVLDQFGNEMEASIKVTGGLKYLTDEWHSYLQVTKPGKMSVKATARDGSNKSKTLSFTTVNTDGRFSLNTLIQDADGRFINTECEDPYDSHQKGNEVAVNSYSGNSPIYVSVGGVWSADYWIDDDGITHCDYFDEPDYGNNSAIAHSITVKGGKITATLTGQVDHYTTYEILPDSPKTEITVKDNTVDKIFGRKKGVLVSRYSVINSGISSSKAYTITANRKSIYGRMWASAEYFDSIEDVPNRVTYQIKNAPSAGKNKKLQVRLTMDNDNGDARNIAWRLGLINKDNEDNEWFNREGNYVDVNPNGTFAINFFEVSEDGGYYDFWDTAPGNYTFYATVGQVPTNGNFTEFVPLGKMTKITVKVVAPPKPSGKFKNTKYTIDDAGVELDIATVTNGLGVWNRVEGELTWGNAYCTVNANTKGVVNRFNELFWVDNPVEYRSGDYLLTDNPVLWASAGFGGIPVEVVNGELVWLHNWKDVYDLKNGNYGVGTPAQQKKAYDKWAKEHLTGYIEFTVVDYTGQNYGKQYQKITVNIDKLLEQHKDDHID